MLVEVLPFDDSRAAPASPPYKSLFSPLLPQGCFILPPCTETQTLTCPHGANSCSSWPPAHLQTSVQAGDPPPRTVVANYFALLFHQRLSILLILVPADAHASQLYPAWSLSDCAGVSAGGALHKFFFLSPRRQWPGGETCDHFWPRGVLPYPSLTGRRVIPVSFQTLSVFYL